MWLLLPTPSSEAHTRPMLVPRKRDAFAFVSLSALGLSLSLRLSSSSSSSGSLFSLSSRWTPRGSTSAKGWLLSVLPLVPAAVYAVALLSSEWTRILTLARPCHPRPRPRRHHPRRHSRREQQQQVDAEDDDDDDDDEVLLEQHINVGLDRRVLYFVPSSAIARRRSRAQHSSSASSIAGGASAAQQQPARAKVALVIALHGSLETPELFRLSSSGERFDDEARARGFVVAYPQGYGSNWNDGRLAGAYPARTMNVDDLAFVQAVARRSHAEFGTSTDHVFVAGFSNGGHFCIRLFYELGRPTIRALASVGAALVPRPLSAISFDKHLAADGGAYSPPPIALLHGTHDPIIPFRGGDGALLTLRLPWLDSFKWQIGKRGRHLSARETARLIARDFETRRSSLGGEAHDEMQETKLEQGAASITDYVLSGRAVVRACALNGEGHRFSHALTEGASETCPLAYGRRSEQLDAVSLILDFWRLDDDGTLDLLP